MFDLKNPILCLAPMDGITDQAYRQIVRKLNPEVVLFSEFTSVNGIKHSQMVKSRLNFSSAELPYIVQIFGNEPELFEGIVSELQDQGLTGIDINMGCPSKRIIRANQGSSLIKDKELAYRIAETCVKNSRVPISVKTRLGWSEPGELLEFAKGLVNVGVKMITVHGRTYKQGFKGKADWEQIYGLKEKVVVTVIGNGDLKNYEEGLEKVKNLDGFMIGRASIGNPWVFWTQERRDTLQLKDKIETMLEHYHLLRTIKEERKALIEFRKHLTGYICGFEGAKTFRSLLMNSSSEKEFIKQALSFT